ncbi:uncharacterized protein LOC131947267 isoform X1 [Physella acuta]|uniref:uncharacterized protein LOC131947267 isoform X1 n=1 Tax=Physella acuta TaxID=109671 RepID=UPI0027DC4DBE|nr:uncharacterized protein LOC131947267 isoform X1 [Physella acuta]
MKKTLLAGLGIFLTLSYSQLTVTDAIEPDLVHGNSTDPVTVEPNLVYGKSTDPVTVDVRNKTTDTSTCVSSTQTILATTGKPENSGNSLKAMLILEVLLIAHYL